MPSPMGDESTSSRGLARLKIKGEASQSTHRAGLSESKTSRLDSHYVRNLRPQRRNSHHDDGQPRSARVGSTYHDFDQEEEQEQEQREHDENVFRHRNRSFNRRYPPAAALQRDEEEEVDQNEVAEALLSLGGSDTIGQSSLSMNPSTRRHRGSEPPRRKSRHMSELYTENAQEHSSSRAEHGQGSGGTAAQFDAYDEFPQWHHGQNATHSRRYPSRRQAHAMNMDQLRASTQSMSLGGTNQRSGNVHHHADQNYREDEEGNEEEEEFSDDDEGEPRSSRRMSIGRLNWREKVRRQREEAVARLATYPTNPDKAMNEALQDGIPLSQAVEEILVAAAQPESLEWEYTLHVHPHFYWTTPDEKVYVSLSNNQTLFITDIIRQVRPYGADTIRKALRERLYPATAMKFLSGDPNLTKEAVEEIYQRDHFATRDSSFVDWMAGMIDSQRRHVIERIARATGLPTDSLREWFLKLKIDSEQAGTLLTCDDGKLWRYITEYDLDKAPVDERSLDWQSGTSKIQRAAFMQRITRTTGITLDLARKLLVRHRKTSSGYALSMLRADYGTFSAEMACLASGR
jgi:hypothetical protein